MTDTSQTTTGYGKVGTAIIASWAASYTVTQLSLHGVDFTELGVSSEIVKSTVVGSLVGFLTWLTPTHLVDSVTDVIRFYKNAISKWRDAANNP